jgi:CRISPR/Cas system CSM-associated protein Csm2 small subunit
VRKIKPEKWEALETALSNFAIRVADGKARNEKEIEILPAVLDTLLKINGVGWRW